MNVNDLFREPESLTGALLLMKHRSLSKEEAIKLANELKSAQFLVGGKMVSANLRWVEDKATGTLKFISAQMPGVWRSGASAVGRGVIVKRLRDAGFKVARFAAQAVKRQEYHQNGPHIFFWGDKTPPADPSKFDKVVGTDEYSQALADRVRASRRIKEAEEPDLSFKEMADVLRLRSTESKLSSDKAKAAYAWLKSQGLRWSAYEFEGRKCFKITSASFKNVDHRTRKAQDERIAIESKLREFGYKVARSPRQVKDNIEAHASFTDWKSWVSPRYIYFW